MKKALLLKIANPLLAASFLVMAGTAVLHHQLPIEVYASVHPASGFTFTLLAIIHIILNWQWIKSSYLKKDRTTPGR